MKETLCHLALIRPDIPQNTGAVMRLAAAFGIPLEIIEPCGFTFSDKSLKRSAMDYIDRLDWRRHDDWHAFTRWHNTPAHRPKRLILFSTKAEICYDEFDFIKGDILMFGSESHGAPDEAHQTCDIRLKISMTPPARSLNLAMSAAIAAAHVISRLKHQSAHPA